MVPGKVLLAALFLPLLALGQPSYPALTRLATFDALQKTAVPRTFAWVNGDGSKEEIQFIEMAIPVTPDVRALTRTFVHDVYDLDSMVMKPQMIIFHAMGDGDLKTSLEVSSFLNDEIPEDWGTLRRAGKLANGAHFIIDRDGTIINLSPPVGADGSTPSFDRDHHSWLIKRHQDGNPVAIGVENVTPAGNHTDLTEAQLNANAQLARWLIYFENGRLRYLASHHQFESDAHYASFLSAFHLQNLQKKYRTRGRRDIGDQALRDIFLRVQKANVGAQLFFEMPSSFGIFPPPKP